MQAAILSLLDCFRFGMLDRRLISVDGKPVKAYLLQNDVWVVSINALAWSKCPHYAPFIPLRANDEQDGGTLGLAGCPRLPYP